MEERLDRRPTRKAKEDNSRSFKLLHKLVILPLSIWVILSLFIFANKLDQYTRYLKPIYPVPMPRNASRETKGSIHNEVKQVKIPDRPKRILYWDTRRNYNEISLYRYKTPFHLLGCKVDNCVYTEDRELANQSDAIIFVANTLRMPDRQPMRLPHQRWVWATHESACYTRENTGIWAGMFNWTMTFRRESTVFAPFGFFRERANPLAKKFTEIALKKTKLVAWIVGHCDTPSKRERYVTELKRYIPVDVYGKCGPLECSRRKDEECLSEISRDYKFYLAFENSIMTDYVTEKFYKMSERDIVLVTRGPANYSRVGIKPSWHINTNDFKSPKDLADYLKFLDKNITAYVSYLEWKNQYESPIISYSYCELCAKLNDPNEPVTWYKVGEISKLFNKKECLPPQDLTFADRK